MLQHKFITLCTVDIIFNFVHTYICANRGRSNHTQKKRNYYASLNEIHRMSALPDLTSCLQLNALKLYTIFASYILICIFFLLYTVSFILVVFIVIYILKNVTSAIFFIFLPFLAAAWTLKKSLSAVYLNSYVFFFVQPLYFVYFWKGCGVLLHLSFILHPSFHTFSYMSSFYVGEISASASLMMKREEEKKIYTALHIMTLFYHFFSFIIIFILFCQFSLSLSLLAVNLLNLIQNLMFSFKEEKNVTQKYHYIWYKV